MRPVELENGSYEGAAKVENLQSSLGVSHTMPEARSFTRNFSRGALGSIPGKARQGWALGCWLRCFHVLWWLLLLLLLFSQWWHSKLEVGQV